jgi:hypothetical protein
MNRQTCLLLHLVDWALSKVLEFLDGETTKRLILGRSREGLQPMWNSSTSRHFSRPRKFSQGLQRRTTFFGNQSLAKYKDWTKDLAVFANSELKLNAALEKQ